MANGLLLPLTWLQTGRGLEIDSVSGESHAEHHKKMRIASADTDLVWKMLLLFEKDVVFLWILQFLPILKSSVCMCVPHFHRWKKQNFHCYSFHSTNQVTEFNRSFGPSAWNPASCYHWLQLIYCISSRQVLPCPGWNKNPLYDCCHHWLWMPQPIITHKPHQLSSSHTITSACSAATVWRCFHIHVVLISKIMTTALHALLCRIISIIISTFIFISSFNIIIIIIILICRAYLEFFFLVLVLFSGLSLYYRIPVCLSVHPEMTMNKTRTYNPLAVRNRWALCP